MVRYHTGKQQKNSKTSKDTKLAECQALAEIRLFKKDVKTYKGLAREIDHQIHQKKSFLVRNFIKNIDAYSKSGGKNQGRDTPQYSHKTGYWRGNQGCWSVTVQKTTREKKRRPP